MAKPNTAQKPNLTPVPAPVTEAPKRGRKPKPTQWAKWGKQAIRFADLIRKLDAMVKVDGLAIGLGTLNANIPSDETITEVAELVSALQKLDADRVEVPKIAKAPKGPAFTVGQEVRMVKKFRDKYLETGLYSATDLDKLAVIKVGTKGLLCSVPGGELQMFIRYPKHLEAR